MQSSIIKNSGRLTDLVQQVIDSRNAGNPPEQVQKINFKTISMSVGPHTAVIVPDSAIKSDGSVDFVFTFKALSPGDTKGASNTGVNAIFVTCYIPELGSGQHEQQFGNQNFINKSVSSVLSYLKKETGRDDLKQGKVGVVGWSGGGGAITRLLSTGYTPNSVVILDGLHSSKNPQEAERQLAATKQFADLAAKDPGNYRFTTVSTGVQTDAYRSTSDTSKDVATAIGMTPAQYSGPGTHPYALQQNGGAQWIQLYQPKENNVDKMKDQHAHAFWWGAGNNNLQHLLGWSDEKQTPTSTKVKQEKPVEHVKQPEPVKQPESTNKPEPAKQTPTETPAKEAPAKLESTPPTEQTKPREVSDKKPILVGDSLMVGLSNTANLSNSFKCFKGGMPTGWMLGNFRNNYFIKDSSGKYVLSPAYKNKVSNVVVMGGVNDLSNQLSPGQIINNLNEIYQLALDAGLKVIACTIPDWDQVKGVKTFKENFRKHKWGNYKTEPDVLKKRTEEVNNWILSQNNPGNGIVAVDTYTPTQNDKKYTKTDFVHFSGKGYSLLADLISQQGGLS
jgi:hypothetical protein